MISAISVDTSLSVVAGGVVLLVGGTCVLMHRVVCLPRGAKSENVEPSSPSGTSCFFEHTHQMSTKSSLLLHLIFVVLYLSILSPMVHAQGLTETPSTDPSAISDDDSQRQHTETAKLAPFLVRLHLIRHGETLANVQNIVLGQGDSPLTENGLQVARLASQSDDINGNGRKLQYWRMYCSDLDRAHRTARIVLGLEDVNGEVIAEDINLVVDARLRELAKGAREGFLKSLTYEEAMELRHKNGGELDVPLLESFDDAWARAKDWIDTLVKDAADEYYNNDRVECNADTDTDYEAIVYDVFALSHSALIRTMVHKMIDSQLPSDFATTREGSLLVPNLSRTVIDVHPHLEGVSASKDGFRPRWTPKLISLTDVSHLSGPPDL